MDKMVYNKFLKTALGLALVATLAGCNTTAGIGRDIGSAGRTIEGAAKGGK